MVRPYTEMLFAILGPAWIQEIAKGVSIGAGVWLPSLQFATGIEWVF